jgi:hypothetical protein
MPLSQPDPVTHVAARSPTVVKQHLAAPLGVSGARSPPLCFWPRSFYCRSRIFSFSGSNASAERTLAHPTF